MVEHRLWLVFFGPGEPPIRWWQWFFDPGYQHVSSLSYFADAARWVYYDPGFDVTAIELWKNEDVGQRLGQLLHDSTAILRIPSGRARRMTPASFYCVGAMKALLGVRSRALSPKALMRDLLRQGAELVEMDYGKPIQSSETAKTEEGAWDPE